MTPADPWPPGTVALLGHGAGSAAGFLSRAFPAARLGVAECRYLDDRSGSQHLIVHQMRTAAEQLHGPLIVGGVSLGGHAAAELLASPDPPHNVVGSLVCLPAWTGAPDAVAAMTASAAAEVSRVGIRGVLDGLDPSDWVAGELAEAWRDRGADALAAELESAARQVAPTAAQLARIQVPVGILALDDDPLHPLSVALAWHSAIPRSAVGVLARGEPAVDRAVFADRARQALRRAW